MPSRIVPIERYIERAQRFRDRAEELRALAGGMTDSACRDQILKLALQYKQMADKYDDIVDKARSSFD